MPDDPIVNPGPNPTGKKPFEFSMELRLLIAFLLMGAVLFLTPYFFPQATPPVKEATTAKPAEAEPQSPPPETPPAKATPPTRRALAAAPAKPLTATAEETVVIDTDMHRVAFSNRGAVVTSWSLKQYKEKDGRPLELVNTMATPKVGHPFALSFGDRKPASDLNQALYQVQRSADGLGVEFVYSDGQLSSRKSFQFANNSYLVKLTSEVIAEDRALPHKLVWRGGFGDPAAQGFTAVQRVVYLNRADNKLETLEPKAAKDGPVTHSGTYAFAGLEDSYFAAVFLPASPSAVVEITTYSDPVADRVHQEEQPHIGAAVGSGEANQFALYVGPKSMDVLKSVDPQLQRIVDFGWFEFMAEPLFRALKWVNNNYTRNYGWSIVVLTILINFALLPLKLTSLKSMKKMQALQPQIKAINERYKGIGLRDPRKAQQNQEVMDLYKKYGVNPMGGCFPMLLQIPFFFAFYKVLTVAIELRGAEWLWVKDLSAPEDLPIRILPVVMVLSQFVMQKMTPATSMDPNQQRIMMFMPLMMGFMFYGVSSGLVLYWMTGNLVGILQQWAINRFSPTPVIEPPAAAKAVKKPGKK